ncbi:hypothetical protein RRX38_16765 [Pseudomonas sp. DTU_2021_1001937_2_SI_NGA_ILE_001]|uniref:hypothetical protein n=1 Tax=Pseudomonas sp. DTU_2021_1001937_2_SI_NGA_ILE_001 TaxID=3077589 RepID=UPI0025FCE23B|nr:hypothetical protein [Pseudomonas sp. DTU_2021_1001937_2_SI_NGA_ILE_001]WNW12731.1 hypothetical protein RRX38_16765 [Pseudomonas sp. DTU_2021_1001937_2_SI_NGA_ILE_001]
MNNDEIIQALQYLIGSRYVPAARAYIGELTGRDRVHGPRDITTREYDLNRITVQTDDKDVITGFSFG